ncbi:hypothetical protein FHG87_003747 [Trinorchestia longiramus]|nr:hypothetical protein FHG87_003747 [Trinorchestia longiramus]
MYGSHSSNTSSSIENSYVSSPSASTHKETLHISPHIAAHKSVPLTSSSCVQSALVDLSSIPASSAVLTPISTNSEITAYRVNSSTSNGSSILQEFHPSTVGKMIPSSYLSIAQKDRSMLPLGGMSSTVRTTFTNLARVNPEDLSASSESKMIPSTSSSAVVSNEYSMSINQQKTSQNLYAVAGEVPASLLPSILGRNSSYFRASDSPNLTGQPQAILVSGLVACGDSSIEHASNPTTLAALPPTSTIMGEVLGLVSEQRIKKEEEVVAVRPAAAAVMQHQLLPVQQQSLSGAQQHRDMMRQALQAAVDGGAASKTAEQELIEYSYSAGDIHDLLMLNIASGTSSGQPTIRGSSNGATSNSFQMSQLGGAVSLTSSSSTVAGTNVASISGLNVIDAATGASVIMMPANCSSHSSDILSAAHTGGSNGGGLLTANLVNSAGHFIGDSGIIMATASSVPPNVESLLSPGSVFNSVSVMDLNAQSGVNVHSLANMNGEEGLLNNGIRSAMPASPGTTGPAKSKKSKNSKLSENDLCLKRIKLAQIMREKRASETEEQKRRRRLREAERMRRRRAMESEEQKAQRRLEAAERARLRRATMNENERLLDRRKAAERMRQRRLNEGEQQKLMRRRRAAERMRKRRAEETPEQRAVRRKTLASMMKTRRRKKQREGSTSCSTNNSLSDDGNRDIDMTPPRHLDDLASVLDDVKAQDLSSTMHLDSHVTLQSSELLMKGDDQHRGEYMEGGVMYGVKYCGDQQRGRKLFVVDGLDSSKLVQGDADAHVLPRVITSAATSLSSGSVVQRKASCSSTVSGSSPLFTSRIDYVDTSLRASSSSPMSTSVLTPLHSRLTYINASSSPPSSSSSPSIHNSILHSSQESLYSISGPVVNSSAASSISSHVPVLRNVASSHASVLPCPQKSSHLLSSSSTNIYTQGSLPTILSSSRFMETESSSNGITEMTPVDSTAAGNNCLDSTGFTPGTVVSNSTSIVENCNSVRNSFSVSNGNSICCSSSSGSNNCSSNNSSMSNINSSNSSINTTRSILRIQNSISSSSSSTFNVSNYCSQDDIEPADEPPDSSLRQYSVKSNSCSPIVMLSSSSRSNRSDGLNFSIKPSGVDAPVTTHDAARNSSFCDGHSGLVSSNASTNGSSKNTYRISNSSFSPHLTNLGPELSITGNNSNYMSACTVSSTVAVTSHSSVISSASGLTTIVLNQSMPTQRTVTS